MNDRRRKEVMRQAVLFFFGESKHTRKKIKESLNILFYNDSQLSINQAVDSSIDMVQSLREAITNAGGVNEDVQDLLDLRVDDLLSMYSTNRIRFHAEPIRAK